MLDIAPGVFESAVSDFLRPDSDVPVSERRERSWDFCFDHFQNHPAPTDAMELSCLHLGYYLASWGMMRGSSFLFRGTNALHYQSVVETIEKHNGSMRDWDAHAYLEEGRYEQYEAAWADLRQSLLPGGGRAITLVSKVMMGAWGCIPSFDTYFVKSFRALSTEAAERQAWGRGNSEALRMLSEIYETHREEIDRVRASHTVWSLSTAQPSPRNLTRAKVLDIYGFHSSWKGTAPLSTV